MGRLTAVLLLGALLVGAGASEAPAQGTCPGIDIPLTPLGYQQQTVSTVALAVPSLPAGARMAVALVETNSIRYRDDGTAPTAAVGTLVNAITSIIVCGPALGRFQAIRQAASDATVSWNYYGW